MYYTQNTKVHSIIKNNVLLYFKVGNESGWADRGDLQWSGY